MSITLTISDQSYTLKTGETIIGRDTSCDIIIQDPSVSRRHAKIISGDFDGVLVDLGSYHGAAVNGEKIKGRVNIYQNDVIGIGSVVIRVDAGPARPIVDDSDAPAEKSKPSKGFKFAFTQSDVDKAQSQNRLKNPVYIALMIVLGVLALLSVLLLAMPGAGKKKRRVLSQSDVIRITREYLDAAPVVTIEGLSDEQITEAAKELFLNAEKKRAFIEIRPDQAYDSYRRYQKSLTLLKALGHKPDYYDRLMLNMNDCRKVVVDKIRRFFQEGWVARKKGDYEKAQQAYQMIINTVPSQDYPISAMISSDIRFISSKLALKGKKK